MSLWDDVNKSVDDQMEMEELERFCKEREKRYNGDVINTDGGCDYDSANSPDLWYASDYTKGKSRKKNNQFESKQYKPPKNYNSEKAYENILIIISSFIAFVLSLIYTFFIAG